MQYRTSRDGEVLSVMDEINKISIHGSTLTNVGRVRGNNEDNVQVWAFDNFMLALVADGMGGAAGGEEASRMAVDAIQADFVETLPESARLQEITEEDIADKMRFALAKANQAVLERAARDHQLHGMGTTATLVLVHGTRAIFAHIGDSRAYMIDGTSQEIRRVTSDHSFVEALVSSGHLTPEQAADHPMRNVLYRALGQKPDAELEIDIYTHDLKIGDRIILCSDGLSRHVKDDEIAQMATSSDAPQAIARQLIALANERGGEDNVSVIVLILGEK